MFKKIGSAVVALAPLSAFAAVPAAVTTSIETAGADMIIIATAVFICIIGLLGFSLMRKAAH